MTTSFKENRQIAPTGSAPRSDRPQARSRRLGRWAGVIAAGSAAAFVLLSPGRASAQAPKDIVSPDAKGVVGGALLGAEVVDLTMGIIGVNRGWPYLVFGALGAVGGGIGGYFIEQETRSTPEVSLYMLAGGMAFVIPTVVVSLNATMYKPPESTVTNDPANNQPTVPGAPTPAAQPLPQTRRPAVPPAATPARLSFSLIDVYKGAVGLSVPAVAVRPVYTQREMWTYGVQQGTEVRVPILYAAF